MTRPAGLFPEKAFLTTSIVLVAAFAAVGALVATKSTTAVDDLIARPFHTATGSPIGPDWVYEAVRDLTALGSTTVLVIVVAAAAVVVLAVARWRLAVYLVASNLAATAVSSSLKIAFDRPRPTIESGLHVFTESFPSGHATLSASIYLTLAGVAASLTPTVAAQRTVWWIAAILAILVGVSRIYLGVHYPTDVMAGWLVGTAWALLSLTLAHRIGVLTER